MKIAASTYTELVEQTGSGSAGDPELDAILKTLEPGNSPGSSEEAGRQRR
jgi:hypothetical protein